MEKLRRGIYLLPNLITITSLFLGFFALFKAFSGEFNEAVIAILVCIVLDGLDGRVARMLNLVSRFGAEFDSLTDAVVFGVVPALTMYLWLYADSGTINTIWGQIGWLVMFFYVASTILRLARFNSQAVSYIFRGLPSPAAAAFVMSFIGSLHSIDYDYQFTLFLSVFILILSGTLMVSNFSYLSLKNLDFRNKVPLIVSFAIMIFFVIAAIDLYRFVLVVSFIYVLSGPVVYAIRTFRKRPRDCFPQSRDT